MEIGLFSFVETRFDPKSGRQLEPQERLAHLLEEIELVDEAGLDVFGVGEHDRPEYVVSTPAVVLAAARHGHDPSTLPVSINSHGFLAEERGPRGPRFVGSSEETVEKILWQHELFGHARFLLQLTLGPMPHREVLKAIELLGTRVAPEVRRAIEVEPDP